MDLRIFTEPQQGATYDDILAVAKATEDLGFDAFFRSDHFLTMGGDGLPGPTDAWLTLAALARETSRIKLGTLVTSATFRHPGLLAVQVAQVDQMSGGRVEARSRHRMVRGGARRLRRTVPGQALRHARRAARDHHRPVVHTCRREVLLRRHPLHADRLARAAQARAEPGPGDRRWQRSQAHAGPRRALRHRVQRGLPRDRRHPADVRARASGLRGGRSPGRRPHLLRRPGHVRRR